MDNMIFALGDNDTDKQFDKTKLQILNKSSQKLLCTSVTGTSA